VVLGVFFNWCVSEKLINENPIKRIKRPTPTRRNAYMTEEDITRIIEAAKPDLALVVKFLADTGIRPQLVEKLCAADINWDEGFAMGFSKGAPYKIYLPKWWLAKLRELASQYPTGPLFRPMVTDKWTPKNIKDRLAYVTKRLNINKCAYSIRHGFATRMLAKGVSVPVVAQLLNHADWKMISKVYSHIDKMSHLMREAIEE
jgi:integrase